MATKKKVKSVDPGNILSENFKVMDIRDIGYHKSIISKLTAGIMVLSSFYCRFISTVFPMLETIDENKESENVKVIIDRFNYLLRTYILSNSRYVEEDQESQQIKLLNDAYLISIETENTSTDVVLTLKYINDEFKNLFETTRKQMVKRNIDTNVFVECFDSIYAEYISFLSNLDYVFISENVDLILNGLISDIESLRDNININSLKSIYTESLKICKTLEEVYKAVSIIEYALLSSAKISDPMNIENTLDIKEMYNLAFNPEKFKEEFSELFVDDTRKKYKN